MVPLDVVSGFDCTIRISGSVNVTCKGSAMIRFQVILKDISFYQCKSHCNPWIYKNDLFRGKKT